MSSQPPTDQTQSPLAGVYQLFWNAMTAVGALVPPILGTVDSIIQGILSTIEGALGVVGQQVSQLTAGILESVAQFAAATLSVVQDQMSGLVTAVGVIRTDVEQGLAAVQSGLAMLTGQLVQGLADAPEAARKWLTTWAIGHPIAWGIDLVTALWHASPPPASPDPNAGAPWTAIAEVRADFAAINAGGPHPILDALAEVRGDWAAMDAGQAPGIPPWPDTPPDITALSVVTAPTADASSSA